MNNKRILEKVHVYGPFADMLAEFIQGEFPEKKVVCCRDKAELEANVADVEALLSMRPPKDTLAKAETISWVMTMGAGVDTVLPNPGLRTECIITNARGIHARQISEYVIGVTLALALDLPEHFRNQAKKEWRMTSHIILEGRTMAVAGLGSIGSEIARKAHLLGMRVIGSRKNPDPMEHVERVFGPEELHEMLEEADFVVLVVPLTPETRGLIGRAELEVMKSEAYLINVARGPVVVEKELTEALQKRVIAGAALDVFEEEPLPPESPLWSMENVIVTPHTAGIRPDYLRAVADLFCQNLKKYEAGETMINIVDRDRGY